MLTGGRASADACASGGIIDKKQVYFIYVKVVGITMGLDYTYVIVLKKVDKPKLLSVLDAYTTITQKSYGTCLTIPFRLDETLLSYLELSFKQMEQYFSKRNLPFDQFDRKDYFPSDDTGEVGFIHYDEKEINDSELMFATFSAVTSDMSVLFLESESVKSWFIDRSKEVNALTAFLDLEDNQYDFIYREGQQVSVSLPGGGTIDEVSSDSELPDFYSKIRNDYKRLFYIY